MNILGRLVGGLLILIGLGWLASTAGLPPFGNGRSANQVANNKKQGMLATTPTATNNFATQQTVTKPTTTPAATAVGSTTDAGTTQKPTTSKAPVEPNPRDSTPEQPLTTQPAPVVVEQPVAPAAVPAGW
jgi:hypothetical protein